MDTSSDTGAPAIPGSVVATKRTPESPGSAITRLNERAALAPPGRSRTDRSASGGPAVKSFPGFPHGYLPISGCYP